MVPSGVVARLRVVTMTDTEETEDRRSYEEIRLQKLEERMVDMVHVAELHELIEEWRGCSPLNGREEMAFHKCADDLEELIEER